MVNKSEGSALYIMRQKLLEWLICILYDHMVGMDFDCGITPNIFFLENTDFVTIGTENNPVLTATPNNLRTTQFAHPDLEYDFSHLLNCLARLGQRQVM